MNVLDALKAKRVTDQHKVWVDLDNNKATFPLFATDGRFVGFQVFSPDSPKKADKPSNARYFTWSSEPALWGLDTVPQDAKVVYVTEAVFRATALHSVGVPAVSVLGSSMHKPLLRLLNKSNVKFVWIGDPDNAGAKLIKKFKHGGVQSPKDLDDMTHDELLAFKQVLDTTFGV
ncbi:DNA primase [Providencia phage vB_PreS_PR1]|uniref:DNA primase n=1 Tax=Providencia phage vB_PreS_PR1 TaxID=1931407 RepID=A0A1S6KUY5_9CAUD|nr:DNA primase [Providencia phage vB_PreS_PR1]AQT25257.1 DNA primase [Providencia phage vB_PreS_PR1]